MHLGIEFTLEIREFGLRCLLKSPKEPMGNKQRMPIRANARVGALLNRTRVKMFSFYIWRPSSRCGY